MAKKMDPETLLMQLLAIPGPSGKEGEVSRFVQKQLRAAGAAEDQFESDQAHQKSPLLGEVGNLVFRLPGTRRGPRRL